MTNPIKAILVDHLGLENIGTNTHDQIDTHIADGDIHFADAPVDGQEYVRKDNTWVASPSLVASKGFRYLKTTIQSGLSGYTDHKITGFNNAAFDDTGGWWDTTNDRFQPNVAGQYMLTLNTHMDGFSSGAVAYTNFNVNGSFGLGYDQVTVSPTTNAAYRRTSQVVYMNGTTDYIELVSHLNGTGTYSVSATCSISAAKL